MKNLTFCLCATLLSLFCISCQTETNQAKNSIPKIDLSKYPDALQKVFEKHGGLDVWLKMKAMSYEMVKEPKNETHYVHLKDRRGRADGANFQIGYDGKELWVVADTSYKGNPAFYHNLMFYFYAMPFVLADDGIVYSEAEPITFEDKTYPGILISYNDDVGISPKDEYILHYDPETYEMTWLGYTATYFTQEKKKEFSRIRYNDWSTFNGLLLPNSITWYTVEEGKIIEPRNTRTFVNVQVSETAHPDSIYAKRAGAEVVEY